jgi:hypothetical protein
MAVMWTGLRMLARVYSGLTHREEEMDARMMFGLYGWFVEE